MTKLQAIRKFASDVAERKVTIARWRRYWAMDVNESVPRLVLPLDPDAKDDDDKAFRANFVMRCPLAKGFADVTISILHEVGHYFTKEYLTLEYYAEADNVSSNDYFNIEAEYKATQWAIEWLQDAEHRKIAKAFEKEYFGY